MDLASVSSIGGGAVAFFPPFYYHYEHIPPRGRGSDAELTAQELLSRCEATAHRLRDRGSDVYGALDGSDSRRGALFCRSGTWLEIMDEYSAQLHASREIVETIRGSPNRNSKYGLLEFISVAAGLVSIRGVEANRYLCMNREGHLYSAPFSNFSAECVFLEEMEENYYNVYSSCAFGTPRKPWYVALRRTGRPRVGKKTRKRRKTTHFLVVHYDDAHSTREPSLAQLLVPSLAHQPPTNVAFRQPDPPKRPTLQHKDTPTTMTTEQQRRNKKKRRRQQRLQAEEAQRRRRKEELESLRARELESLRARELDDRDNRITPRLSGAGYQIRPRRTHQPV